MRIQAYLTFMAVAILVPIIAFSAIALRMLQAAELQTALRGLQESAHGVSLLVDRELYSTEAALQVLAASPSLAGGDLAAFYNQAKKADRGPNGWTVLTAPDGQQLVNTVKPFGTRLPPPFEMALVDRILNGKKTVVSDVRPGPVTGRMVTTLSIPVQLEGGKRYVLNGAFNTDHFKHLIDSVRVPEGWLVAIIDTHGLFIARNVSSEALVGKAARPELVAHASKVAAGQIRHYTLEGTEAYDVFTHSTLSGWTIAVAAPVEMIELSARRATIVAVSGMLAAILFGAAVAYRFGGGLIKAIERAAQAASDLGQGKVSAPVTSTVVEVNALHTAIREAGVKLQQAQAFRQHAEGERESLLAREQSARHLAEMQNKAKDQFLAMLGHELRNPLAPISNAAQLLRLPGLDEKRVRYTGDVITRQVQHMNSLLDDLLDVSRVTRGLVVLKNELVDMAVMVPRAVEQVDALVTSKHHQLVVELPSHALPVHGDATRLIQILVNILNNAAKYTPPHGRLILRLQVEDESVRIRLSDNGIGIAPDLLPHVFDLFSQGERSLGRSQGGLGLGLALVKSLVALHGGTVSAQSAGLDQGTTIDILLPLADVPLQPVDQGAADQSGAHHALSIVVVDDNIDAAETLAMFLQEVGRHHVSVCHDAREALELVKDNPAGVFILDIGLPDMDGYALARHLRSLPGSATATLIALTGYGQAEDMARAKAAGFDHHIAKPAEPEQILALLASVKA